MRPSLKEVANRAAAEAERDDRLALLQPRMETRARGRTASRGLQDPSHQNIKRYDIETELSHVWLGNPRSCRQPCSRTGDHVCPRSRTQSIAGLSVVALCELPWCFRTRSCWRQLRSANTLPYNPPPFTHV